jgi:hypothetical protein
LQKYQLLPEHLKFDVKTFIINHINDNKNTISFKIKSLKETNFSANLVLETLFNYKKALHKIPSMAANYCWLPTKSYEQASSELTAFYKSSLFSGQIVLDICGGLGVDDMAFAKKFEKVISLDSDNELNEIVKCNNEKLFINNIERISTLAETFLASNSQKFDLVYIDADRRPDAQHKIFKLEECTPNIFEIWQLLIQCTSQVLLKLSPLVDLVYCQQNIPNLAKIYVVAVKNEVKEVLIQIDLTEKKTPEIIAVNLISDHNYQTFTAPTTQQTADNECFGFNYFFEPNAAIIKAGLSSSYAKNFNLNMLSNNSHFFVGNQLPPNFMGRSFKIIHQDYFSKSGFLSYLKNNQITKANISKRNFPINEIEIAKQFKIKDGGDDYLFFTQNRDNKKVFFHCRKIDFINN